jgi:hypothetical protein
MASSKRTPRSMRYRSLRITPEAVEAFRQGDGRALHEALQLRPWEMSLVDVHLRPEPRPDTKIIWLQSWWMAMRLRQQLEAACAGVQAANPSQ